MSTRLGLTLAAAWLAALGAITATAHAQIALADDAGRRIVLARPAARVVPLAPSLTEIVYAAGGGAALAGTDTHSDHPRAARALPRVGDALRIDVERVLALRPDLVLVWRHGNTGRELAQLEAAGLTLFQLEPRRLDEVPRAIERVGTLLGTEAAAREAAQKLRDELDTLRRAHANAAPVRVFYQVWPSPLMTLNREHMVSDVIALCGGVNVFADLAPLVPQVSIESVVVADPQVIIASREAPGDDDGARREAAHPAFAAWARHPRMAAVRRGHLYSIAGDHISRQGPRVVLGARAMCGVLDEVRRGRDGSR
jgi:iron complex transport system substrate-binding protein